MLKSLFSGAICNIIDCAYASTFDGWYYVIGPGIFPLFSLGLLTYFPSKNEKKSPIIHSQQFELKLINDTQNNVDVPADAETMSEIKKYSLYIFLLYFVIYFIALVYAWLVSIYNHGFAKKNYTNSYYLILLTSCSIKKILKKIANKCDEIRMVHNTQNSYLSLQYFIEFYVSLIYYYWLRQFVAYHTFEDWSTFAVLIIFHILSEICESCIRFSTVYHKLIYRNENIIFFFLKTNDALSTWHDRMSMDFVIRYFAALLTGVLWIITFLSNGKRVWVTYWNSLEKYENGIMFLLLNIAVDILYFFIVYTYNYSVNKYNIFNCFYAWLNSMNAMEKAVNFLCLASMTVIYYLATPFVI